MRSVARVFFSHGNKDADEIGHLYEELPALKYLRIVLLLPQMTVVAI
jgi:hypothetical protein